MKKVNFLTGVAGFMLMASSAFALDTAIVGSTEWSVENEVLETEAGVEFGVYEGITITPTMTALYDNDDGLELDGVDITVNYSYNPNIDFYGTVEMDDDLEYTDALVGVKFRF